LSEQHARKRAEVHARLVSISEGIEEHVAGTAASASASGKKRARDAAAAGVPLRLPLELSWLSARAQSLYAEALAREMKGAMVLAARVDGLDRDQMRSLADTLRNKWKSAVIVLGDKDRARDAALERVIDRHPEWNFPGGEGRFDAAELERHAAAVKTEGNKVFWSDGTGRFVAGPDANGERHDYGFTFLNTDAIHYDFATPEHARQIVDWLDGKRIVAGDTSTGADIYRFRFGPRSTTRRNVEYYFWGWSKPESITFGGQVQDGGAVLGWSFMDLSARLKVDGPDAAWKRLREIAAWFDEVQAGGGYREYYKKQGAVLQGDGAAVGGGGERGGAIQSAGYRRRAGRRGFAEGRRVREDRLGRALVLDR
jgi:hypothetical protein